VYEPLRVYLLYTSSYLAVRGVKLGWNKLQRTGAFANGLAVGRKRVLGLCVAGAAMRHYLG